jgi:hypothetical protein
MIIAALDQFSASVVGKFLGKSTLLHRREILIFQNTYSDFCERNKEFSDLGWICCISMLFDLESLS